MVLTGVVSGLEILPVWTRDAFVLRGGVTEARNSKTKADSILQVVPTDTRGAFIRVQGLGAAVVLGDHWAGPVSVEESIVTLLASVGLGLVDFTVREGVPQAIRPVQVESVEAGGAGI